MAANLTDGTGYTVIHSFHKPGGKPEEWLCVDVPLKPGDKCPTCGGVAGTRSVTYGAA